MNKNYLLMFSFWSFHLCRKLEYHPFNVPYFVFAAFNIYTLYKSISGCEKALEDAKTAATKMREARTEMNRIHEEVKEAKKSMEEVI